MRPIRVLSWNVRWQGFARRMDRALAAIADDAPDIVTLQEVPRAVVEDVRDTLDGQGLVHSYFAGSQRGRAKEARHGVLVAARHPVAPKRRWAKAAKFPALLARVSVDWPGIQDGIDVISAHIPNGASNGWVKVEHLQLLGLALQRAPDAPRILTGDFNEPQQFRASGQIVPWGCRMRSNGGLRVKGMYTKGTVEPQPRADWGRAVRDVLSTSAHGLVNVIEATHGLVPTPATHVTNGGGKRCFDHGFASRHFEVVDAGYHHGWRTEGVSDHSALWFVVRARRSGELAVWA